MTENLLTIMNGTTSTTNDDKVNVQALERCSNEKIDKELDNFVNTVEDMILNATLAAVDKTVTR